MANPQKENGFTQISNELFEAILKSDLTLRELKTVFIIIRYTYGFHRKSAELSVRFISEATNIKFQHIAKTINKLENKNLIFLIDNVKHKQGRQVQLNKNYESWKLNSSQKGDGFSLTNSQRSDGIVPKEVTETVPKKVTKKENYKENIKHDRIFLKESSSKPKPKNKTSNWRHRRRSDSEKVFFDKKEIQKHFSRTINEKDFFEINNLAERYGKETMIDLFNSLSNKMHSTNIWSDESIEAMAKESKYRKNVISDKQNQITKEDELKIIGLVKEVTNSPEEKGKVFAKKKEPENKPVHLNLIKDFNSKAYADKHAYN